MSAFMHLHAHSRYSTLDGMSSVAQMVEIAAKDGQPGLALTDHGLMSGSLELYKECKKYGIRPFPGIEAYLVKTLEKEEQRYHCGLLALNLEGYRALVKLSSLSHGKDHFHRKPRISFPELLEFGRQHGRDVVLLSGCYFGIVIQTYLDAGESVAGDVIRRLAKCFPHFYIEIQMHNTVHKDGSTDWDLANWLMVMAHFYELPVVVTQDAHYAVREDKPAHEMMKKLGYMSSDESEILFPGNSYHLATTGWMEHQYQGQIEAWEEAQGSFRRILVENSLEMPALDNYKFHVPRLSKLPNTTLREEAEKGLAWRKATDQKYQERLNYELSTIKTMGYANYFLLTSRLLTWCSDSGILTNTRGSANGSLVCWALGITQIDPLKWGISFDRFMHPTRQKPPDIDVDVERDRRQELIAHISEDFDVTSIGTFLKMGESGETGRGSVFVKYLSYKRKVLGDKFKDSEFGSLENLWGLDKIVPDDAQTLRRLARMSVLTGGGTHAAGYVLASSSYPLSNYIPTMLVGGVSGNRVTQMTMDDCETAGYVKEDFLGVAALTTVAKILEAIGRKTKYGLTWIPDDDKQACAELSSGRTGTGIFQFEGYSTAKGARQMRIRNCRDAIICLALTRPASLDAGADQEYMEFRKRLKKPAYIHPIFEQYTKETYGVFVIQDQVIDVIRAIGMSYEDLNDMLKAVKASNERIKEAEKTFARIAPHFKRLCVKQGMSHTQAIQAWNKVRSFSDYGFNRAHATAYGLLGYRMAYLKIHYPLEFMCATLQTWAGTEKEPVYQHEARRMGITIHRASVHDSDLNWTIEGEGLRKGLLSTKGIGPAFAEKIIRQREIADFYSEEDLQKRCGKVVFDALGHTLEPLSAKEEEAAKVAIREAGALQRKARKEAKAAIAEAERKARKEAKTLRFDLSKPIGQKVGAK